MSKRRPTKLRDVVGLTVAACIAATVGFVVIGSTNSPTPTPAKLELQATPTRPVDFEPVRLPSGKVAPQTAHEETTLAAAPIVDPAYAPSAFHPRPPEEWQGMLVDLAVQPLCDRADGCGLGMACHDQRCGPCTVDDDCALGEACVLDHCIPDENLRCRSKADCGLDELCTLSGYSADPRGNAEMVASCRPNSGGREQSPEETSEDPEMMIGPSAAPSPFDVRSLAEQARQALL